jgi:hypothetical protein
MNKYLSNLEIDLIGMNKEHMKVLANRHRMQILSLIENGAFHHMPSQYKDEYIDTTHEQLKQYEECLTEAIFEEDHGFYRNIIEDIKKALIRINVVYC